MIKNIYRRLILSIINVTLCGTHFFAIKSFLIRTTGSIIGQGTKIVGPIMFNSDIEVGEDTWIGCDFKVYGNGYVKIGSKCDIAPNCKIVTGSHFIGGKERRAGKGITYDIIIGNGTWLGADVTISGDVNIGCACVVGCGSLVLKSFGESKLLVGRPAQVKRSLDD